MLKRHERLLTLAVAACALTLCTGPVFAAFTVDIILPDTDDCLILAGYEYDFEAVAYLDGQPLPSEDVTWSWDFGDMSDPSTENPTVHTYENAGTFIVIVTATYSAQQAQDSINVTAQDEEGGGPRWVMPGPNDVVASYVEMEIAPALGWPITDYRVWVRERGDGVHECAPWEPYCDPGVGPFHEPADPWNVAFSWNPQCNSWGHNSTWDLRGEVDSMMMGQVLTWDLPIIPIELLDVVIHSSTDAPPPGMPDTAFVVACDPTASGTPYATPTISWEIEFAKGSDALTWFTIEIRDLVTGQLVRTYSIDPVQDPIPLIGEWQWDGKNDQGQLVAKGLYRYLITTGNTMVCDTTGSLFLEIQTISAEPQPYDSEEQTLTFNLNYELADDHDLEARSAKVSVINASYDNPEAERFTEVVSLPLDTALGPHEEPYPLDLPPLDGSPYFIVIVAQDAHAEEIGAQLPVGSREHADRPAHPKCVKLTYSVTQVHPDEDGRVYISDTLGHYSDVPLLYELLDGGAPRKCQTANHEATIQALTTLSAHDDVDGNEGTTMNQASGGVTVHFKPIDPDSDTLWDPDGGGDDNQGGNGSVNPVLKVAEHKEVDVEGQPQKIAIGVAETTLTFTNQYSGDNYTVEASPYDQTLPEGVPDPKKTSHTLTAWKLIYYERDRMPAEGLEKSQRIQSAGENQPYIEPFAPFRFHDDDPIMLFDAANHDWTDEDLKYIVDHVSGDRVYLKRPLQYAFSYDLYATVLRLNASPLFLEAIDPGLLDDAFGQTRGFVTWKAYPQEGNPIEPEEPGVFPRVIPFQASQDHWDLVTDFFDHEEYPNVVHFLDGQNAKDHRQGWADESHRQCLIFRSHADTGSKRREHLVHECGHLFDLEDFQDGHPDHWNLDPQLPQGAPDACVMVYDEEGEEPHPQRVNDFDNDYAQFGGGPPTPGGEPEDLRLGIAGHTDPISKP